MLPKWFKHTRNIRCGRKIICIDQLYGWRGSDTGYYGSEELEEVPDFLDEVKVLATHNEGKNERLKILRKEAEERLKKEREIHPNFNILTDRAPTPDFSVTYIDTSYNASDQSVIKSQEKNIDIATDETGKCIDADDKNIGDDFDEPMENSNTNLTYTIAKDAHSIGSIPLISENRMCNSVEHEPVLELQLDGTFIVEKSHEIKDDLLVPVQKTNQKEMRNVSLHGCGHVEENELSPRSTNQKIFGCPAPLQATFDLSRIDKVDLSVDGKNEILRISPVNSQATYVSHSNLPDQKTGGNLARRVDDRTAVSFKTPKQLMKTLAGHAHAEKQSAVATPLFKKKCIASTASRGTSTPVEGSAFYVCPRYDAHHTSLASHATQTGSGTPVSINRKFTPELTPVHRPFLCPLPNSCESTIGKPAAFSRIPLPTSALVAISQYGTPSPTPRRNTLVDYDLTPQSHVLSRGRTPLQENNTNKVEHRLGSMNSKGSVTQIPMSRFAFEHLKSGGTPRPTSNTERKWKKIANDNSLLSLPRTPIPKTDISRMLVDNVMRSGPACRRRPHFTKLLSPIGKLRFEKTAENSNSLSSMNSAEISQDPTLSAQEGVDETRLVVIDSFDGNGMGKLAEDTASLSITEKQNISLREPEAVFDATASEYRKQSKTPVFDTGNYFGRRRILSMLNESNVSVHTPGKEEEVTTVRINPSFSGNLQDPSDTSTSPVHIIAAKDENKHAAILCARKIVHCEETEQGLRRSARNRVAPIRRWLGEKPVYRRDQQGTYELIRVEEAIVKDPLFIKYNTVDMAEVLERQKREQKQHARARKLRRFDRARRGYTEDDAETNGKTRT
uniref:Uncharacterized protein n=1 Tax=Setaria digitata TaxID=48799 RepID=A0A915Q3W5_9BILA